MKNPNMQKSFIEKLESLRKLVRSRLSDVDVQNLQEIMGKLAHYHYNKRKYLLLGLEKDLYALLVENGYNPFTVYRCLLVCLPQCINSLCLSFLLGLLGNYSSCIQVVGTCSIL